MKQPTLQELSDIFKEGFERTYKEYYDNMPEVLGALEASNPRFLEEYFFNNGIKYLMEKLCELQELKDSQQAYIAPDGSTYYKSNKESNES